MIRKQSDWLALQSKFWARFVRDPDSALFLEDHMKERRIVNACHVPTPAEKREKEIYLKILDVHCEQRGDGHECRGTISINRNTITLSCPLCGDSRKTLT